MIRSKRLISETLIRDFGLCQCCGFKANSVHHIVPLCFGGKDELDNMVALCEYCHKNVPNTEEGYSKYANGGGAKIVTIYGVALQEAERRNLSFNIWFPAVKGLINHFREIDYTNQVKEYAGRWNWSEKNIGPIQMFTEKQLKIQLKKLRKQRKSLSYSNSIDNANGGNQ